MVNDIFLWQLIDFPTRKENILNLLLTNVPENISGYDNVFNSDHKLINFQINLQVVKRVKPSKRIVYNYKRANWPTLKPTLINCPWDVCFDESDVEESLRKWTDMFLSAVNEHIPKYKVRNNTDLPWVDSELRNLIKQKDKLRRKAQKNSDS